MTLPNELIKRTDANTFSFRVETLARRLDCSYIDATLMYCDQRDIEIESVHTLCNRSLKDKLQFEAETLNLLTTKHGKLPI